MPKVSVIITCYNYGRFLAEAVESVVGQTYKDYEIIIVNDGSTDDTKEVSEALVERYPGHHIRIINQENQGVCRAKNNGIAAGAGEYVMILDGDDMLMPTYLEEAAAVLDNDPGITIAYTDVRLFGNVGRSQRNPSVDREYDFRALMECNIIVGCCLFRKSAWENVGGYKADVPGHHEDWELWISMGKAGYIGKFINKRLYLYRKHGNSRTDSIADRNDEFIRQMRLLHPDVYDIEWLNYYIVKQAGRIRELENVLKGLHTVRGFIRKVFEVALRRLGLIRG